MQAGRQAGRQAGKQAGKHTGKQAVKQAGKQAGKKASRQASTRKAFCRSHALKGLVYLYIFVSVINENVMDLHSELVNCSASSTATEGKIR